jgi:hypothetical protein
MRALPAAMLVVALALTGCGAAGGGGGTTNDEGGSSSTPVPEEQPAGELSLPETFPADQVPLIEGDLAYSQDLGTGWVVYIHRDDFVGGYDEAKSLLLDAGFAGETVGQDGTGAVGQFTTDLLTVNLSAGDGADLGVGPSVGYTVVKNGE